MERLQKLKIERTTPEPLYLQIASQIRSRITSGLLPPHHKLEAEDDLARSLGVSRGTLHRALGQLTREGLLVQIQGKGTFVSSRGAEPLQQRLVSLGELMERHKVPFRTDVLSRHTEEARGGLKMFLGPGPVLVIRRLRSLTDGPVAISENAVSLRLCPGLEDLEDTQLIDEPLYRLLEERLDLQLSWAERIFDAVAAERSIAEPLEVPVGTPLLFFEQFTYLVGDKPIERSRAWIRTDRQRLYTTLRRSST